MDAKDKLLKAIEEFLGEYARWARRAGGSRSDAVEESITYGVDATHFAPNDQCTRGQIVTFLHRAKGNPAVENAENPFEDVEEGVYYYNPILWAAENGVTAGVDATHFAPNAQCNRAEVVTFLYRANK